MKKGSTSVQNIAKETMEKFRDKKRKYEGHIEKDVTNDQFLKELLK